MQFPLRDFFWLTIVIGLTIGIAMERKQSLAMSGHEGRAQWWEKAAREVAERLQKATGEAIRFDEMKQLDITVPAHVKKVTARGPGPGETTVVDINVPEFKTQSSIYARDTRQPDLSWVTGMIDLDFILLILILGGPLLAISILRRKDKQPLTIANPNATIWKEKPWFALWVVPLCLLMSLNGYLVLRSPFTGALLLFQSVLWTYYYCEYVLAPRLNRGHASETAAIPGGSM